MTAPRSMSVGSTGCSCRWPGVSTTTIGLAPRLHRCGASAEAAAGKAAAIARRSTRSYPWGEAYGCQEVCGHALVAAGAGIEGLLEAVTQEVEGQDGQGQGQPGEGGVPPGFPEVV